MSVKDRSRLHVKRGPTESTEYSQLSCSWFATTWQGGHVEGQYNSPFPSFPGPLYQNEVKCSAWLDQEDLISCKYIKLIFTRKVVRLASFWRWGFWNSKCPIEFVLEEFTWKWSLVPRGEKCFCSWSPIWPLWRHVHYQQYGKNSRKS